MLTDTELAWPRVRVLRTKAFGTFYSQGGQDVFLAALLFPLLRQSDAPQWIVDVGCNHPTTFSNSYFFESRLGCRTLAIDPLDLYSESWAADRPSAIFERCALGSAEGEAVLNVPTEGRGEPGRGDMLAFMGEPPSKLGTGETEKTRVRLTTLSKLLDKHGIDNTLLCSIDVEGFEMEVLEGLDFERHRIACFCIENNTDATFGGEGIRNYLAARDYVFVARISYLDDVFVHASVADELLA